MNEIPTFVFSIFLAYLLGSIPFGKLAGKLRGIDIQKRGSGNIGAANAVRVLGWKLGLVVLFGDIIKGFIPVSYALYNLTDYQALVVAAVVIIGHIFPVWLKFKGGKGVATGLGVVLALNPGLAAMGVLAYLVTLAVFRQSAPSSMAAAWSLPIVAWLTSTPYPWFYLILAIVSIWTHRSNIKQMIKKMPHAA